MANKVIAEYFKELKISKTVFEEKIDRYRWLLANVNKLKRYIQLVSESAENDNIHHNEEWCCGYLACLSDILDNVVELEADAIM